MRWPRVVLVCLSVLAAGCDIVRSVGGPRGELVKEEWHGGRCPEGECRGVVVLGGGGLWRGGGGGGGRGRGGGPAGGGGGGVWGRGGGREGRSRLRGDPIRPLRGRVSDRVRRPG